MHSKEAARLAGVTVRTLRHYHQIGVLPEPPRRENGYRDYGAVDVARVLRIKRLASLGLSLGQIRTVLEGECGTSDGPGRSASELASRIADLLSPVLAEYLEGGSLEKRDETDPVLERLIRSYDEETFSPIQARVSQLAETEIRARLGTLGEGDADAPLFSA